MITLKSKENKTVKFPIQTWNVVALNNEHTELIIYITRFVGHSHPQTIKILVRDIRLEVGAYRTKLTLSKTKKEKKKTKIVNITAAYKHCVN